MPWNPIGAILGPLGLIALVFGRRKKGSKAGTILALLLVITTVSMTLAACGGGDGNGQQQDQSQPVDPNTGANQNSVDTGPGNETGSGMSSPGSGIDTPTVTCTFTPSPTSTGTPVPAPTGTPTPSVMSYNINFTGTGWTSDDMLAAMAGVEAVARKFAEILGGTSFYAWSITFGYINLQMGVCTACLGTEHSGHTSGAHQIEFAGMSDTSADKRRNLVVHELGHAFKWLLYNKTGIDVYTELTAWRTAYADYPDRQTFSGESGETGPAYGFHSLQNQITWQQSLSGEDSEEFADQFLGWVFNKWQENPDGTLHRDGKARADMMDSNMPYWVSRVAGP